jgi:triosephosphate isomerase
MVKETEGVEIIIAPPFTALHMVSQLLLETRIGLAAQNMHWEDCGAYTGEISPLMLREIGCQYVILGHSERRAYSGESDQGVNKKILTALKHQLIPIVCIGESLAQRKAEETLSLLSRQLETGLAGLSAEQMQQVIIAYEPIWAIGSGLSATPEQAQEVHAFIRQRLAEAFGAETANRGRILYGVSVKPENIAALMAKPDIDGALVGGASLEADKFAGIVKYQRM